jgi:hypothetical protein
VLDMSLLNISSMSVETWNLLFRSLWTHPRIKTVYLNFNSHIGITRQDIEFRRLKVQGPSVITADLIQLPSACKLREFKKLKIDANQGLALDPSNSRRSCSKSTLRRARSRRKRQLVAVTCRRYVSPVLTAISFTFLRIKTTHSPILIFYNTR